MNENKDIKARVLERIQAGEVSMTPKFYFVFKVIALVAVSILTLFVSSLLISFVVFSLIQSGTLFLLGFGARGFFMFFLMFPWPLLALEVILIALLNWLLKQFKLGYRSSLSTLVLVILCMSAVVSLIIGSTSFHKMLLNHAEKKELPIVGGYYREIRRAPPSKEIFRGVVSEVGTSSFVLLQRTYDGSTTTLYKVLVPPGVSLKYLPIPGDMLFVAGHILRDNDVQAYGFQKLPPIDNN